MRLSSPGRRPLQPSVVTGGASANAVADTEASKLRRRGPFATGIRSSSRERGRVRRDPGRVQAIRAAAGACPTTDRVLLAIIAIVTTACKRPRLPWRRALI